MAHARADLPARHRHRRGGLNWEVSDPTTTTRARPLLAREPEPRDSEGLVTGIAIVVVDITERKQLEQSQATLTRAVVRALSASVEMRDPYTAGHQERVAQLAVAIAAELDLDTSEIDQIGLAARIHDIGKLSVPAELLTRPGRLSDTEMAVVRMHSQAGFDMLKKVTSPTTWRRWSCSTTNAPTGPGIPAACGATRSPRQPHHRRGADVVESMASTRPYREALGVDRRARRDPQRCGHAFRPRRRRRLRAPGRECHREVRQGGSLVPACG